MFVCLCQAVTENELEASIDAGANSIDKLQEELSVGTNCGCCMEETHEILKRKSGHKSGLSRTAAPLLSHSIRIERANYPAIEKVA